MIFIGTAAWSIPRAIAATFTGTGTHLERYARVLSGTEINSSFYRPHAYKIYQRWAQCTPPAFRFSVKIPRTITHDGRLSNAEPLHKFLSEVAGLGAKLGVLLVQLPPSLAFDTSIVDNFFTLLRKSYTGSVVCEPRHKTWFEPHAENLLTRYRIGRVAADPAIVPQASIPGGWMGVPEEQARAVIYYRLHGSPRIYWSRYSVEQITQWAEQIQRHSQQADVWFIFDNTAAGYAIENALELQACIAAMQT